MSLSIEEAIRAVVAAEVAAAERRIMECLAVQNDITLSFTEACQYLQISSYTLRNYCNKKLIPFWTHGSEGSRRPIYQFSSRSLDKWKAEQEQLNYKPKEARA